MRAGRRAAARAQWAGVSAEERSERMRALVRMRWARVAAERGNENGGPAAA
ncbi:hypothetical protein [Saccharothrix sp. NRRL B-16314]|uniref:hypothetical protein n=1 Tax=Saccharothrix sp. NRRL B-16314 TaxID=1463825 RepID=UPI0012DE6641|nr:hypothetical protein [Saccharothrix sp. NRRL B-16314]